MNVALLIDKSVPADVANALKETVATAAGVDTTRGDTITSDAAGVRQAGDAQGRPGPDDASSARPSGSAWASPRCCSSSS